MRDRIANILIGMCIVLIGMIIFVGLLSKPIPIVGLDRGEYDAERMKKSLTKEEAMSVWSWKTNLGPLYGRVLKIETRDGSYLKGKLSGVESYTFGLDGRQVTIVSALILDDDPEKSVDVSRLKKVEVYRPWLK